MVFKLMVSRKWWWTTLLVIAGVGVLVRLGLWQLDRLEQRRAFNAHLIAQIEQGPLILDRTNADLPLEDMEYRAVVVRGIYDTDNQVALRNQVWNGMPGYTLLTPLRISDSDLVVLVNRGWVPSDENTTEMIKPYLVEGEVEIFGLIRKSQEKPDFGGRTDPTPKPGEKLLVWNLANISQIQQQLKYDVMPIYVQRIPDETFPKDLSTWPRSLLPFPSEPDLEITEGPHLGYALQWFTFATILALGYPVFLTREDREAKSWSDEETK